MGHCHDRNRSFDLPSALPRWFGPRASPDDPAVSALIARVARGAGWADMGNGFNLSVRIDAEPPVVLRVHRPWVRRGRVAGLRRLRERLQRTQVRVAWPVRISGRDLLRVGDRWAEMEEFIGHVQPPAGEDSYLRLFEDTQTPSQRAQGSLGAQPARTPRRPQNTRATALLGRLHTPQARTPQRPGRASDAPADWRALQAPEGGRPAMRSGSWGLQIGQRRGTQCRPGCGHRRTARYPTADRPARREIAFVASIR